MRYEFNPQESKLTGVVSFAHWSNADLQTAIRQAFHESPRERIVAIEITRDGIKALFEQTNTVGK